MASHGRHASGHTPRDPGQAPTTRRRPVLVVGGIVGAVAVAGVVGGVVMSSGGGAPVPSRAATRAAQAFTATVARVAARTAAQARLAAAVTITPGASATGVALDAPVQVSTSAGRLRSVTVTPVSGTALVGTLSADGLGWRSGGGLAASTTYRVTGLVAGDDGSTVPFESTFATLTPVATVHNTLWPDDGLTVGVGQPVVVRFSRSVPTAAQATVESRFSVTESQPVPGGWHWFSPTELHFRPETFWPANEQVTVADSLDGWDVGDGVWGTGSVDVHFAVGPSHVATANLATEQMTVTENGAVVATYPISGGSTQYPTMNGTHIALDRESVVHMVSGTVGIPTNGPGGYNELVYDDVHISDSGEYVHAAPWSVGAQGHDNVSHGCINLSPTNALAFFNFSRIGDVVQVVGGPRPAAVGDHGVMDWGTDWSQWTPGVVTPATAAATTAVPAAPAPAPAPTTVAPAATSAPDPADSRPSTH